MTIFYGHVTEEVTIKTSKTFRVEAESQAIAHAIIEKMVDAGNDTGLIWVKTSQLESQVDIEVDENQIQADEW